MSSRVAFWLIIILVLAALYVNLPPFPIQLGIRNFPFQITQLGGNFPLKLGLDLQGGTELVLATGMSKIKSGDQDTALESARDVIEKRVNLFGVSEAKVQSSKVGEQRRILVELPGVKDSSAAASLVGKTAQLDFRELPATFSAEQRQQIEKGVPEVFFFKQTGLTGADLKKAEVVFNQGKNQKSGSPQVSIQFTDEGARKFGEITKRNINKPLGIFIDNQPVDTNPPIVQQEILGGNAVISGSFSLEYAKGLARLLNAGALPVPIHIVEQRSIGPELGQQSIDKSFIAGLIGLLTVMVFMALYYGRPGLIADVALIIYSLFVLAIFRTGLFLIPPVTLTLAGIAGFILSIGMAVDANILIFERIKEERRWGRSPRQALELGFKRAWSSIRDSNVSSLITAAILYYIGTGLVKGFAVTLAIGVAVSMFTAVTVTRTILRMVMK